MLRNARHKRHTQDCQDGLYGQMAARVGQFLQKTGHRSVTNGASPYPASMRPPSTTASGSAYALDSPRPRKHLNSGLQYTSPLYFLLCAHRYLYSSFPLRYSLSPTLSITFFFFWRGPYSVPQPLLSTFLLRRWLAPLDRRRYVGFTSSSLA